MIGSEVSPPAFVLPLTTALAERQCKGNIKFWVFKEINENLTCVNNMSTLQERLATFLAEYNLSAQSFERKCNIGVATASKLSENSRETTFAKIAKAYPQLNIDWLKTGDGQMLNPQSTVDIDVDLKLNGHSQLALRDINNIGDAKTQIIILQERIKSLEKELSEKNARIDELNASLDRERKMNDYLMGQK